MYRVSMPFVPFGPTKEEQKEFDFVQLDVPCRTCSWFWRNFGKVRDEQVNDKWYYGCHMGGFRMGSTLLRLPSTCKSWRIGGERMPWVDFSKMKEDELRAELEKIRAERRGVGSRKRVKSRERRISGGKRERKPKEIIRL